MNFARAGASISIVINIKYAIFEYRFIIAKIALNARPFRNDGGNLIIKFIKIFFHRLSGLGKDCRNLYNLYLLTVIF
jgi:hypothetical protein